MSAAVGFVRKKRNFKALQLDVAAKSPVSPSESEPVVSRRVAPAPAGKKRPPPMTLKAPKIPNRATTPAEGGGENGMLTVDIPNSSAPPTASISASENRSNYHSTLSSTLANLDLNSERKYDLRNEDLRDMQELGQGNGGSVKKVEHVPTGTIMAKKVSVCGGGGGDASCTVLTRHLDISRLSSSTRSRLCASRSCASCKSCTIAIRSTLSPSTARSYQIPISASAWNTWTRAPSMGYTRRLGLLTLMWWRRSR